MTKTVFTPPLRMVGVTSSIMGPSRRWTTVTVSFMLAPFMIGTVRTVKVSRGGKPNAAQLRQSHYGYLSLKLQLKIGQNKIEGQVCPAKFSGFLPGGGSPRRISPRTQTWRSIQLLHSSPIASTEHEEFHWQRF